MRGSTKQLMEKKSAIVRRKSPIHNACRNCDDVSSTYHQSEEQTRASQFVEEIGQPLKTAANFALKSMSEHLM